MNNKATLEAIEKIIQDQMKAANAYCCESLIKILDKIKELDWPTCDLISKGHQDICGCCEYPCCDCCNRCAE